MTQPPRYEKPSDCLGCPLHEIGHGYVPGSGPVTDLLFLGEAPGFEEALFGQPFVGAAGGMHNRLLHRSGLSRDAYRHENVLRCVPPAFEIKKAWAEAAATHCRPYRQSAWQEARVIVAMGQTAIREALGLWNFSVDQVKVENFHGTVHERGGGQIIVPTYHPSYLQRGAANLFQVVSFDLAVALECLQGLWQPDPIDPIIDPPIDWFRAYVDTYLEALRSQPDLWLAVDIETPDKEKGKSEDELTEDDKSFQIDRVNFAYHPDEGVTVPYAEDYIPEIQRCIAAARAIVGWNFDYDSKRLLAAGTRFHNQVEIYDGMWLAHHLQSNVPLGLGFWAPFYSRHGAWKHLFSSDPGTYAALDGPQELRTVRGVVRDLQAARQWDVAKRHTIDYMQRVLKPAQIVGIHVDRPALEVFEADLTKEARFRMARLQEIVPQDLWQLTPKEGLSRPPMGDHAKARTTNTRTGEALANAEDLDPLKLELYQTHAQVIERQVRKKVLCCLTCGAEHVQARHKCPGKGQERQLELREVSLTRWFWREPFNPDSPPQVMAYIKYRKHTPGRNKKTKKDSTDRDTLQRLRATTKDAFYKILLELRAVSKVRGTYAIGVRKRLDAVDRFHPTFTLRPSTLRNSAVAPNIQNVVSDRGEDNLAAGFRRVVTATDEIPEWAQALGEEELRKYV